MEKETYDRIWDNIVMPIYDNISNITIINIK